MMWLPRLAGSQMSLAAFWLLPESRSHGTLPSWLELACSLTFAFEETDPSEALESLFKKVHT
jgi:hypothetical protein